MFNIFILINKVNNPLFASTTWANKTLISFKKNSTRPIYTVIDLSLEAKSEMRSKAAAS